MPPPPAPFCLCEFDGSSIPVNGIIQYLSGFFLGGGLLGSGLLHLADIFKGHPCFSVLEDFLPF